jgi:hypothetical protein
MDGEGEARMKRSFHVIPVILVFLLLSSCAALPAANPTAGPAADSGPRVSFAEPESDVTLPMGPVRLLILCEDLLGTSQVELLLNGVAIAMIPSPDSTRDSVILEYVWLPPTAGQYVLQAHAQNTAGTWGAFTALNLTITDAAAATETPMFEAFPTAGGETTDVVATPTADAGAPAVPTATLKVPVQTGISLNWSFSYLRMFEYGSACEPQQNGVIVTVSGISTDAIDSVMIFFRPKNKDTGVLGTWSKALRLELLETGAYGRGFSSAHFGKLPFVPAVILHQFVITDNSKTPIYYSDVYQEMYLGPCVTH